MSLKDVIVITGGSGCLAQHLIKELQIMWADRVAEIRVIDKQIYKKILDYPDNIPIKECIADCARESEISAHFKDATMVFHMAARPCNFDMYPNVKCFMRNNVAATKVVVAAMVQNNVPLLIHTSDANACLTITSDAQGSNEHRVGNGPPKHAHVLGSYGETKCLAQKFIRESDGKTLANGQKLHTIIVSPPLVYGECDNWYVPHALRLCKQYGTLQRFGDGNSVLASVYAGNVAHAELIAAEKLRQNPDYFGSQLFLITENTSPVNYYSFIEPFINMAGYKLSSFYIPFLLAWPLFFLLELFFGFFFVVFGVTFPHNFPTCYIVRSLAAYYYHFNSTKSRLELDYLPKYDPKEAMQRTLDWWKGHYKKYM